MAADSVKRSKDESEDEEVESSDGKAGEVSGTNESTMTVTDGNSKVSSSSVTATVESGLEWLDKLCGLTPTSRQGQLVYMLIMLLM